MFSQPITPRSYQNYILVVKNNLFLCYFTLIRDCEMNSAIHRVGKHNC